MKFKEGKLPDDIKERMRYLYRFQELLRIYHNQKAKEMREGKITLTEFRFFQKEWFDRRNDLLCLEINKCKVRFQSDKNVTIDIADIEEDDQ